MEDFPALPPVSSPPIPVPPPGPAPVIPPVVPPPPPPTPPVPELPRPVPSPLPSPLAAPLPPPLPPPPKPSIPPPSASPFPLAGAPNPSGPPPPPPPPTAPPAPLPPEAPAGNLIERLRGLIRPLEILGVVFILGLAVVSFASLDFSRLPLIGGLFQGGEVTLTYWGLWESPEVVNPLITSFIEEYKKENPRVNLTINYEKRSFGTLDQYRETLLTRLQQGTGPDIFRLHNSWVGDFSTEIAPLPAEVLSEQDYALRFYPAALASAKVGTESGSFAVRLLPLRLLP